MQTIIKLNVFAVFRRSVIVVVFAFRRERKITVAETNVFGFADDKQTVAGPVIPMAVFVLSFGDLSSAATDKIAVGKGDV